MGYRNYFGIIEVNVEINRESVLQHPPRAMFPLFKYDNLLRDSAHVSIRSSLIDGASVVNCAVVSF
jgi:hypothetical protein